MSGIIPELTSINADLSQMALVRLYQTLRQENAQALDANAFLQAVSKNTPTFSDAYRVDISQTARQLAATGR
ncbi:MAG: hypothetical protein H7834_04725 [Magnetococcus sp. YQC-9]